MPPQKPQRTIAEGPPKMRRRTRRYDVPLDLQATTSGKKIETVTLAVLSVDDQINAHTMAGGNEAKVAAEVVKMTLAAVNGRPVNSGDGSADEWLADMDPRLQELVSEAYVLNHQATEAQRSGFFQSAREVIGDG